MYHLYDKNIRKEILVLAFFRLLDISVLLTNLIQPKKKIFDNTNVKLYTSGESVILQKPDSVLYNKN